MTKSLAALLACLALGLVAAGCGSSSNNSKTSAGGGASTSKQKQPSSGGTAAVTMKNLKFNPTTVSVPAGSTVKWTNDDSVGHDVTAASFKSGSPGGLTPGDSFSHTFKKSGTYKYVCTIHKASGMTGTVIVK